MRKRYYKKCYKSLKVNELTLFYTIQTRMKLIEKGWHLIQPKCWMWETTACKTVLFVLCLSSVALAQPNTTTKPQPIPPILNPLELPTSGDPLLPNPPIERELTPLERLRLSEALDELNHQATAELQAGNISEAFELWYREIRLRRVLGGQLEEVKTLGRVGEIAWRENSKKEVQLITARLKTIEQNAETTGPLDRELLNALGQAYQQVRVPGQALKIYEQILADTRQQQDIEGEIATLKTMGQLHMAWFDYPKAAATYQELLAIAQRQGDRANEIVYTQQLAYIYDQSNDPKNALQMKERLVELYPSNDPQLPALKIAIATDYEALSQPEAASQNYQEAYQKALELQQLAYGSEALQKLATLYHTNEQPEVALQIYEILVVVEQQSYDFYGLMNTYDRMGQIYLEQKNYNQALELFKQGLELAQSLNYQETYFFRQIERVNQQR